MKVSTKRGDTGTTSIFGNRIEKTSLIIEVLGEIDTCIAECILLSTKWDSESSTAKKIVEDLNCICAILAGYSPASEFTDDKTIWLEQTMDQDSISDSFQFVYPFGNEKVATINHLRTTVRKVERVLYHLNKEQEVPSSILRYINRLSDFWFVIGCREYLNSTTKENAI